MRALTLILALLVIDAAVPAHAAATLLIRDATVYTMTQPGALQHTDVLVKDGKIAGIGQGLMAPPGAPVIDAKGRPVTPGLFGGVSWLGLEEIGEEPAADDQTLRLGSMRPEFDVSLAFNPESIVLGVTRLGGITFTMLGPSVGSGRRNGGGSIIAGQGAVALLDGVVVPKARALFIAMGGQNNGLSGGSRAAQFMLLEQAIIEVRSPKLLLPGDQRLLTPEGRQALARYLNGVGPIVFEADRGSDIEQVLAFAQREKLHNVVIQGGDEAWRVAGDLAAAKVPVILNALDDLPESFDSVGATLENAARLYRAGVKIAFTLPPAPHNIRKIRQTAGVAVAHGLPWEAALAAITRNPAEIFGVADRDGTLVVGHVADLVLWSGDPLDVTSLADRVIVAGVDEPMRSRQTELRDRYLVKLRADAAR